MKRKCNIICLVSLMWFSGFVSPVYAVDSSQKETTQVIAEVASYYHLTIPMSSLDIPFGDESTPIYVQVTGNVKVGEEVVVTMQEGSLVNEVKNDKIPYDLKMDQLIWNEQELRSQTPTQKQTYLLIQKENWNKAMGGRYQGHIIFNAKLQ